MSNLLPKASFKIPSGSHAHVLDIGDYYTAGGMILKKDLTLAQLTKTFTVPATNGVDMLGINDVCYYFPSQHYASLLKLKGSGSLIRGYESSTTTNSCSYCNVASLTEDGQFCNYFDSTLGSTAGKRLVFEVTQSSANPGLTVGQVNAAGDVTWIYRATGSSSLGAKIFAFAETNNYIYVMLYFPSANSYARILLQLNKATWGTVAILGTTGTSGTDLSGNNIKYLGKTSDNKVWLLFYAYGAPVSSTRACGLFTIDLSNDTSYYSSNVVLHVSSTNTVGLYVPTSFSVNAADNTKYKYYSVSDPNNASGSLVIKMALMPTAGMTASSNNFAAPTFSTCTLTGAPAIGTAYTAATLGAHACEVDTWVFTDNSKEYLAVCYHTVMDLVSSYINNNLCPVARHAIYVFEIDATNPLNLIYKSTLANNAFGSGMTCNLFNKSVDGKTLAVGNSQGFTVITWNRATESFLNGPWNSTPIMNMHIDESDQLWIRDYQEMVYLYSPTASNNIVVSFDVSVVNYTGGTASANVLVSSYDFSGNRQAVDVQLNITGAVFTANSSTSITVTTLTNADLEVPISITAPGNVVCTPVI